MKKIALMLSLCFLSSCSGALKEELEAEKELSAQLGDRLKAVEAEKSNLEKELEKLKRTDQYYYQQAVHDRKFSHYSESNQKLKEMIEKFPSSSLKTEAKKIMADNNNHIAKDYLDQASKLSESGDFEKSDNKLKIILADYSNTDYSNQAKTMQIKNVSLKKKAQEKAARAGSDLELIDWGWNSRHGYFIAEGRVKNISDSKMKNVEVLFSTFDAAGEMISTDAAIIEYNPILPNQTSPFKAMMTANPAAKTARVEFKYLMGGSISTYRK